MIEVTGGGGAAGGSSGSSEAAVRTALEDYMARLPEPLNMVEVTQPILSSPDHRHSLAAAPKEAFSNLTAYSSALNEGHHAWHQRFAHCAMTVASSAGDQGHGIWVYSSCEHHTCV